jgi:Ser/Thr protein kinase RdoA (MazF antagonist)
VARLHRSLRDVHVAGGTRTTRSVGLLGKLRERFVGFAADPKLSGKLDWNALVAAVTGAAARLAAHASELPCALVHGDVNPGNFVHRDGAVAGLIDFDFLHESERAYDVATGMDEFGRSTDDATLDLDAAARFSAGYAGELALLPAERGAMPDLMIRRNATLVWYIVTRHGERAPGEVGNAARYAARVREIEKLRAELPRLTA